MTEDGKMRDLDVAIATMRAMSKCTEPQEVVRLLQQFVNHVTPADRALVISRRGLEYPYLFSGLKDTDW